MNAAIDQIGEAAALRAALRYVLDAICGPPPTAQQWDPMCHVAAELRRGMGYEEERAESWDPRNPS